jgi:hypothetical protein
MGVPFEDLECWFLTGSQGLDGADTLRQVTEPSGPHHTVLSSAVGLAAFADLADRVRTELLVVDADTTTRGFAGELRWNRARHRSLQRPLMCARAMAETEPEAEKEQRHEKDRDGPAAGGHDVHAGCVRERRTAGR